MGTCSITACATGFYDADGKPENGCEGNAAAACSVAPVELVSCPVTAQGLHCSASGSCYQCVPGAAIWREVNSEECWTSTDPDCEGASIEQVRGMSCANLGDTCVYSSMNTKEATLTCTKSGWFQAP
jgi:hypothetical protein